MDLIKMAELVNALRSYGPLGLIFIIWFIDRNLFLKTVDSIAGVVKADLKESSQRWYDLSRQIDNHILLNVGALTEVQALQREIKDRIDVLLRRGDR